MNKANFDQRVITSAQTVWDYIGGDCLVDEDGLPDLSVTMTRRDVIEMVSDADRMRTHGSLSKEDMRRFYSLDDKAKKKIMVEAFPFNTYGW